MGPSRGLLTRVSDGFGSLTVTAPLAGAPRPEGLHRARSAVATVGLGRRPPDEPERLPSDRPGPCGPSGLGIATLFTSLCLAPHPVARCEPCPAPSRAGGSLRATPRYRRRLAVAGSETTFAAGKMRLTDFCNRLPSRAPCGSLDSRLRPVLRCTSRRLASPSADPSWAWAAAARLGSLPFRLPDEPTRWSFAWRRTSSFGLAATITRAPEGIRPEPRLRSSTCGVGRSPGGAPIDGSSAPCLPPAVFSTARRACDTTSGVPSCPSADPASLPCPHRLGAPGPAVPPPRQRRPRSPIQDAFHRRVLPPPAASALARLRVGSRGARHRCRCSRAGGFRHRDPASGAPSPAELARVSGEPAG